jgi:hypothetical protein
VPLGPLLISTARTTAIGSRVNRAGYSESLILPNPRPDTSAVLYQVSDTGEIHEILLSGRLLHGGAYHVEASIPFDLDKVDLAKHQTANEDYYQINQGLCPGTRLDDGGPDRRRPAAIRGDLKPASESPQAGTMGAAVS